MRATTLWRLASMLTLVLAPAAAHSDDASRAAIARLLEVGWENTPQARVAADLQFDEVERLAFGDTSALTTSLLVLMQQRRYDEAQKRVDDLLAKDESDFTALRAKAWIAAILKNYAAAMVAADKLSQQLAAVPPATEEDAARHRELIAFLGRLFGYLGGPVADSANQGQRRNYEKQIVGRLGESQIGPFEEARDGVLQKFVEMTDARLDEREKAVADAQAAKEQALADIEADRQQMAERGAELTARRKQAQDELQEELAEIGKLDAPLVRELARLEGQAAAINRELLSYAAEIDRLRSLAARERDPVIRRQFLLEADRLSLVAGQIDGDLVAINRQAASVQTERAALAARRQRAQATAATEVQRIDKELTEFAKREKRNDGIEKRASRPVSGTTSKARSLSAQATALSTYDPFPLEVARQQLLDSLR
jgi:hypothetical protein